jgi:hypothetical protein
MNNKQRLQRDSGRETDEKAFNLSECQHGRETDEKAFNLSECQQAMNQLIQESTNQEITKNQFRSRVAPIILVFILCPFFR